MIAQSKRTKLCFLAVIILGCGGLFANSGQAQSYSINAGTSFGTNGVNDGTAGPTFTDNMDGTFTLANGTDSGTGNAVYIDSSEAGSISALWGSPLTRDIFVTVSGTVTSADIDYHCDGVEFGLVSVSGFRAAPNLLFQIDADGARGGFAPFFGTSNSNANVDQAQTPGVVEASLNDGYSFIADYCANDIFFTVYDIVTENEVGTEPVAATSFTFSLTDAVAADPSLASVLNDYVANFPSLVGDSFVYFSHQNSGGGNSTTFSQLELSFGVIDYFFGDINLDGNVDFLDIAPFINLLANGEYRGEADFNLDGQVNFLDIAPFILILTGA